MQILWNLSELAIWYQGASLVKCSVWEVLTTHFEYSSISFFIKVSMLLLKLLLLLLLMRIVELWHMSSVIKRQEETGKEALCHKEHRRVQPTHFLQQVFQVVDVPLIYCVFRSYFYDISQQFLISIHWSSLQWSSRTQMNGVFNGVLPKRRPIYSKAQERVMKLGSVILKVVKQNSTMILI